jgi:hypothetical protein
MLASAMLEYGLPFDFGVLAGSGILLIAIASKMHLRMAY